MAYLVGSSYLEWLEKREGAGSLRRLWKRMASRRGGRFSTAFRGVFGGSPADLYDRFRAETTAHALASEKALEAAGLVAGEKWQRLEGATQIAICVRAASSPLIAPLLLLMTLRLAWERLTAAASFIATSNHKMYWLDVMAPSSSPTSVSPASIKTSTPNASLPLA